MIWSVDVEGSPGPVRRVAVSAIGPGAPPRVVAEWFADDAFHGSPAVEVSPCGGRVAVVAGGTLRVIDAEDASGSAAVAIKPGTDPSMRPVIAWRDGEAVVVTDFASPRSVPLEAGWTLEIDGDVIVDGGFSGGDHQGRAFIAFEAGISPEAKRRARAELRQQESEASRRPVAFRLELRHGATEVVVLEERRAPVDGTAALHWPPVVARQGVLLRRSTTTMEPSSEGGVVTRSETRRPWLVSSEGAVHELPVDLAVSPLAALPDGTWLMPGADALWRDDYDEPLHRLLGDGRLEPVLWAGEPVTPSRLVRLIDPASAGSEIARHDNGDALWTFEAARVDHAAGELRLLLTDDQLAVPSPEPLRWHAVALPLAGTGALRVLGTGATDDATALAVAL